MSTVFSCPSASLYPDQLIYYSDHFILRYHRANSNITLLPLTVGVEFEFAFVVNTDLINRRCILYVSKKDVRHIDDSKDH